MKEKEIIKDYKIDNIITIRDGFFNYFKDGGRLRKKIKKAGYTRIFFLFNNSSYHDYRHIILWGNTLKGVKHKYTVLPDGSVRKLSRIEIERLQTLPDGYTSAISRAQATKGVGNGWTVDVIAHILKHWRHNADI